MANERKENKNFQDSEKGEILRRFKTNPAVFIGTVVVLVIIIVAFVLVPAIPGVNMGAMTDLTFGSYNKTPITYAPGGYFAQIRENIAWNQQNSGQDINNPFMNYQIWRAAFEQTVTHTAILSEMKKAGYTAPNDLVDREVAGLPRFQENGVFSAARYRQLDKASRAALWREVQEELVEERYRNDITSLLISSNEASFIKSMASPERSFDMAVFPFSSYPDNEVSSFAESNRALFQETRLSKITVKSSEAEAKQVLGNIQSGSISFEDAAKAHSSDTATAEKGGDMGIKMAYELRAEIPEESREAVLALTKGNFSEIIKTDAGWTFFRAEDDSHPADIADTAVIQKIKTYILDVERGRVEDFFLKSADSLIADAKTDGFDAALIEKGLAKKQFGPVPLNYGNNELLTKLGSSVPELGEAASKENFWRIAFSTPLLTPSAPFSLGNSVAVLFPTEEKAADEANADAVESSYSSFWLSYVMDRKVRDYFLKSDKLKDNFTEIYFQYFNPEL